MNLPDLDWQWVYLRMAWGIVVASLLLRAWPRTTSSMPRTALGAAGLALAAMWLPHGTSPAYWLGLMFQYPSVMLVACCAVALATRHTALHLGPAPGPRFALVMAVGGLLLYADSSGWLHAGLYARGFDPRWGPLAALLAGAWAVWALRSDARRTAGLAVLACVIVFSLTRLPSGNVFDAFLDPLIWAGSVAVTLRAAVRHVRRWRGGTPRQPAD